MKKIVSSALLIFPGALQGLPVQIAPVIVSSAGGAVSDGEFKISATIGQPAVLTKTTSSGGIFPGFWTAVHTNLSPVAWFNSHSFGVTTLNGEDVAFDLALSNAGNYPYQYSIRTDAAWNGYEWLSLSKSAGEVPGGGRDVITVTVIETANLQQGAYDGRLLITTNTGAGLSRVTDTVGVSLMLLPETGGMSSGDIAVEGGDSPPMEVIDESGNSLGVTFDFSQGAGGTISVSYIPAPSPSDTTTGYHDPDSLLTDPAYAGFHWEISTTVPDGFLADISFDYASQVGVPNPQQLRLARRMNHAGPGVLWQFVSMDSVDVNEAGQTITALSLPDFSQWTIASEKAQNPFEDIEAPVLSVLTVSPGSPRVNEPVTVSVAVTDESPLETVRLYYLKGGAAGFTEVAMSAGGSAYSGVIPAADVTLTGIACFVRAVDTVGHGDSSDTLSFQVRFDAETLSTGIEGSAFPSGIPKNRWRLISVPAELDDPGVSNLLGDPLEGERARTVWEMVEWTGSKWTEATALSVGKGYWLYQRVKKGMVVSTGSGRSLDLTGTELTLQPGWNLIGSPYSFAVGLDVDHTEFYGPLAYGGGEGEGWSDVVSELLPWGGYALFNRGSTAQTIHIKPLRETGTAAGTAESSFEGWKVKLSAKGKTYSDVANFVGRVEGAKEELDYFDNPEPPYVDRFVSLGMSRPEWSQLTGVDRFTSDIRSMEETNGTWDIDLYVDGEEGPVTLSGEIWGEVPGEFQIVLLDLVAREAYDLISGDDEIVITDYLPAHLSRGKALPYPLKVIAGSQDYVTEAVNKALSLVPEKVALSQNYPNPFNPTTRIRYAMPKPQLVTLKVYNLLGQEVVVLVRAYEAAGRHEVVWDGRDARGRQVASGMYLCALRSGSDETLMRKMLLLR